MPKKFDWEEIRKFWQKTGASPETIIEKFGVSRRSIDERLAQWRATEKAPNVVTLKARSAESRSQSTQYTHPPIARRLPKGEQIDELESIENAIASLSAALAGNIDPKSMGGIAGGLIRLFERREKLQPKTAADIARLAIELGISPTDFAREMRSQCQSQA